MKLILLSGGSGRRLWPLSNDVRSKQFLKVLPSPCGYAESMIQRVVRQISESCLDAEIVIATSVSQKDLIESQLGLDVHIVVEPMRRDTFPAIALSTAFLKSELNCTLDEIVVVLPCDQFVDTYYFDIIRKMGEIAGDGTSDIVLMGIEPESPSSGFGYIIPESKDGGMIKVNGFIEKPNVEKAKSIIGQGGLWNGGVFAFRLGYMMKKLEDIGFETEYKFIFDNYGNLPKNSFDYEVVEKANSIIAVPYKGKWKDLGSWDALVQETVGNSENTIFSDCSAINVVNELAAPIVCIGVENIIVAASDDGVLVTASNRSGDLKKIVENLPQEPMSEEHKWGGFKIIDRTKGEKGFDSLTKHIKISTGESLCCHIHNQCLKIWIIIKGCGVVAIDGKITEIKVGDIIRIASGQQYSINAVERVEMIEVQIDMADNGDAA